MGERGKIKAVIFDIGGVFVPLLMNEILEEISQEQGIREEDIWDALVHKYDKDKGHLLEQLSCGYLTEGEFGRKMSNNSTEKLGRPIDMSGIMVKFEDKKRRRKIRPALIEVVKCIRAEGVTTAVLTNNWRNPAGDTDIEVDRNLFDLVVESCRERMMKPYRDIYKLTLNRLKVKPGEALFVDDLKPNVETALKLGMRGIWFQTEAQCLSDLEKELGFPVQGFVEGTTSVPKRLQFDVQKLYEYLQKLMGIYDDLPMVRCYSHGQSNPTYYVQYGGREMVLRKKPPGKLLPSAHAVEREYRVMKALRNQGVPVPEMIALCEDPNVIGTPFFLMEHVKGRIFKDHLLPGMFPKERGDIYRAMCEVLAKIHKVDLAKAGLTDYGRRANYIKRNFKRWYQQFDASRTGDEPEAFEELCDWLRDRMPTQEKCTLIHGDFRLDNLMFHPEKPEVVAVLDWEISTLGEPLTDLATNCLGYYITDTSAPSGVGALGAVNLAELGIPSLEEYTGWYCQHMGLPNMDNLSFFMAFVFFRMTAIAQGVHKRYTIGQASSPLSQNAGIGAHFYASVGLDIAQKANIPPNPTPSKAKL